MFCIALNRHWGHAAHDKHYKSAKMVIRMLVECVSKGGNLLLNVGPNVKGEIPKEAFLILKEVGEWIGRNGNVTQGRGIS